MRVVFDKENARSFFKQLDQHKYGDEIMLLLKKQVDLKFNFELDDVDDILQDQILIFNEVGGRTEDGLSIDFEPQNRGEDFCLKHIEKNDDVYLVNTASNRIKVANKVLIGSEGEEFDVLIKLFPDKKEVQLHDQRVIGEADFSDWTKIEQFVRPFSSAVIVDRYMFSGSATGGNYGLFEYNLKTLLGKMYQHQTERTELTFIFQINTTVGSTSRAYEPGPDLAELKSKIKAATKSLNRRCPEPRINLIAIEKGRIEDDHDRHIITDYVRFKSGDSLIYFDSTGLKATRSNEFDIYSLARRRYRETTRSLVDKLKDVADEAIRRYGNKCLLFDDEHPENVIPL